MTRKRNAHMNLKIHLGDLIFMSIQFHEILELQNIAFFAIALIYQILIQRPSWKQDQKIDWHNFEDRNWTTTKKLVKFRMFIILKSMYSFLT